MTTINRIADSLIARLTADIEGLPALVRMVPQGGVATPVAIDVKRYPDDYETVAPTLAKNGSVLVRYLSAPSSAARVAGGKIIQDRAMKYTLTCVSDRQLDERDKTGIFEMLDIAGQRVLGFVPDGAVGPVTITADGIIGKLGNVWNYSVEIKVPAQWVAEVDAESQTASDHSVELIRQALVGLIEEVGEHVFEGMVHPVTPDTLPGFTVWVEGDTARAADDTFGGTGREVTLCIDGYAAGVQPDGELSAMLADVESALWGSDANGGYLGGKLIDMRFASAERKYFDAPFHYGKIMIRFTGIFQTENN